MKDFLVDGSPEQGGGIVVVGGGPAAWTFCKHYQQEGGTLPLTCISEEALPPYNRANMSRRFTESSESLLYEPPSWYAQQNIDLICNDQVIGIDRSGCTVTTANGLNISYSHLVLATGSCVSLPNIPGLNSPRVIPYRKVEDIERILNISSSPSRAHVLGGGLLGLEAAWELNMLGIHVEVIEMASRLIPHYLDDDAARFLKATLIDKGLGILTTTTLTAVHQRSTDELALIIEGENNRPLTCDLLLLASSISPRDELARHAGLQLGKQGGIAVDASFRSSDPYISAIGECANVNDELFGLIQPVMHMAKQLAKSLAEAPAPDAPLTAPALPVAVHLKLADLPITIIGNPPACSDTVQRSLMIDAPGKIYRSVFTHSETGTLEAAILIGENAHWEQLAQMVGKTGEAKKAIGLLASSNSTQMSPPLSKESIFCQCEEISLGQVSEAIIQSSESCLDKLQKKCGVAQGCGSCSNAFSKLYKELKPDHQPKGQIKIFITQAVRSFHLFSSLAAAAFLLFFAISGFAMNHRDDLGLNQTIDSEHLQTIAPDLLEPSAKQELLQQLHSLGARGEITDFERDESSISITYESPSRYFQAEIDLENITSDGATAEITIEDSSLLETLGEIHRSKKHGEGESSLFIDLMALLMSLVSISGILLFLRMASRKSVWTLGYFALTLAFTIGLYFILK